jgi:hypothetical protein
MHYHNRASHHGERPSVWDIPHVEHSNVKSSGNMPNRSVLRTSRIGCAQFGQRGGFGVNLSPELLTTD